MQAHLRSPWLGVDVLPHRGEARAWPARTPYSPHGVPARRAPRLILGCAPQGASRPALAAPPAQVLSPARRGER